VLNLKNNELELFEISDLGVIAVCYVRSRKVAELSVKGTVSPE
jgi:hypothetical protein